MMKKGRVLWCLVVLSVMLTFAVGQTAWADIGVDTFETSQAVLTNSGSSTVTGAGIIGGTRYMEIEKTGGGGNAIIGVGNTTPGILSHSNDSNDTTSTAKVVWSGTADPNDFSLGANLSAATQFEITIVFDDLPVDIDLEVYTSASQWSKATLKLPGGITSSQVETLDLATDFTAQAGGGVDWANVNKIRMKWSGPGGLDLDIDQIEVPEEFDFECLGKTFTYDGNTGTYITLPSATVCSSASPCELTAKVTFQNNNTNSPITVDIEDTLDPGLAFKGM
ncbi:MAG: hypothetical protein JRI89_16920, partial [Deltaproteobacteria bacterium]|nr:hypothetical protein [Deltaproteobacteria bacterium]